MKKYERITCERRFDYYRPGESIPAVPCDYVKSEYAVVMIEEPADWRFDLDLSYAGRDSGISFPPPSRHVAGPIVDRLFAYEELGYSPEELAEIIEQNNRIKEIIKDAIEK